MRRPWFYGRNKALWFGALCGIVIGASLLSYGLWEPGRVITDGNHDRGMNGIWLAHGWLGDDEWFARTGRDPKVFRNRDNVRNLASRLTNAGITDLFPHLCPCEQEGLIPPVNDAQTKLFLSETETFRVMPWVGGVLGKQAFPDLPSWRNNFISSIVALLKTYPDFAGVHLNIEPLPSGNRNFVKLLKDLRAALPDDKILSVAAYPPPTLWHPFSAVHWDRTYFTEISSLCDQMVVMMYDTSLRFEKVYRHLISSWTAEVLAWAGNTEVLVGLPTYGQESGYHLPWVENLKNGLMGLHGGLSGYRTLPGQYRGISLYSEWEMDQEEWTYLRTHYVRP
jgi:hypothetical protein